jgi:hypothetical protein
MCACCPRCAGHVQACLSVCLASSQTVHCKLERAESHAKLSTQDRAWRILPQQGEMRQCAVHERSLHAPSTTSDQVLLTRDLNNCRNCGQHHRASIRDASAAFPLARRQAETCRAERHFAASITVVSVADPIVSVIVGLRFTIRRNMLHGASRDIAGFCVPLT